MQVRKASCIRNPSAHPVYSITNSKTQLRMPLLAMCITNVPVIANLHDNSGVGTFLLRISGEEDEENINGDGSQEQDPPEDDGYDDGDRDDREPSTRDQAAEQQDQNQSTQQQDGNLQEQDQPQEERSGAASSNSRNNKPAHKSKKARRRNHSNGKNSDGTNGQAPHHNSQHHGATTHSMTTSSFGEFVGGADGSSDSIAPALFSDNLQERTVNLSGTTSSSRTTKNTYAALRGSSNTVKMPQALLARSGATATEEPDDRLFNEDGEEDSDDYNSRLAVAEGGVQEPARKGELTVPSYGSSSFLATDDEDNGADKNDSRRQNEGQQGRKGGPKNHLRGIQQVDPPAQLQDAEQEAARAAFEATVFYA